MKLYAMSKFLPNATKVTVIASKIISLLKENGIFSKNSTPAVAVNSNNIISSIAAKIFQNLLEIIFYLWASRS